MRKSPRLERLLWDLHWKLRGLPCDRELLWALQSQVLSRSVRNMVEAYYVLDDLDAAAKALVCTRERLRQVLLKIRRNRV